MSDFCDFVPDDPSCQTAPEPEVVDTMDEGGDHMDHDGEHGNPMIGNLTYLSVALFTTVETALATFRYHEDGEMDDGAVLGVNWWKIMEETHHYMELGFFSVLTVTQILSMLGIAGEINIMAWMYAEMIEGIVGLLFKFINLYATNKAYNIGTNASGSVSAADQTKGTNTYAALTELSLDNIIYGTATHMTLHLEHENWMRGQIAMLPEEAQAKYKKDGKEEHDDEIMEFIQKTTGYFMI